MDPKRVESYNQIKMCMCVDAWWSIYLVDGKPNKLVFVFTPSVGVEHFWVNLDGSHVFAYS